MGVLSCAAVVIVICRDADRRERLLSPNSRSQQHGCEQELKDKVARFHDESPKKQRNSWTSEHLRHSEGRWRVRI
jgi:hypothetical protein